MYYLNLTFFYTAALTLADRQDLVKATLEQEVSTLEQNVDETTSLFVSKTRDLSGLQRALKAAASSARGS